MKKVLVLGCGMMGEAIALDLHKNIDPTLYVATAGLKASKRCKDSGIPHFVVNCSPGSVRHVTESVDLVIGALPGHLGFRVLEEIIESKKPYVDISFMPEDPLSLTGKAAQSGVPIVVDCGFAPGLANMIIGYWSKHLDYIERVVYYVGGLPKHPKPPLYHKASFCPSDTIEEYIRPARFIKNGKKESVPALHLLSRERLAFNGGTGLLESRCTDGLRTLLSTINTNNMEERTIRHPGHFDVIDTLKSLGFLSEEDVDMGQHQTIAPVDLTCELLHPHWQLNEGEEDYSILDMVMYGSRNGKSCHFKTTIYDAYDSAAEMTSMARMTAFPCAIVARMILDGTITGQGVFAPEILAMREGNFMDRMARELDKRGINIWPALQEVGKVSADDV